MNKFLIFSLSAALCGSFAMAQQIGCLATTSSVIGSYTYIATELPMSGVVFTPPGTGASTQVYSNTQVGKLISSINGGGPFSYSGVLYFDGAGNISVAAASSPLGASVGIGTYTVNADCTISVSLSDVFNTTTSGPGVTNPTFGKTSLIGLVLGGGTEIDLSAAQSSASTNGNMPIVSGEFASRLDIQLIRTYAYGCSVGSLTGAYGLVGQGYALVTPSATTTSGTGTGTTTTTTSTVAQPLSFIARVRFDGNGNIVADAVASGSPLASFQYSGTYTVNLDCSGTLTLGPATTALPSGSTTPTLAANFVLTPPVAYLNNGTANLSGNANRPSLQFTVTNSTETLMGYGRAQ